MMPARKSDYVRCAWMTRYCSFMCPHCQEGRGEEGHVWYWCWYGYNLTGHQTIKIIEKQVAHFDDFGNIYVGEVW